jgi:hypothetical protein
MYIYYLIFIAASFVIGIENKSKVSTTHDIYDLGNAHT